MIIPKSFEILGHRVTVRWCDDLEEMGCHGSYSPGQGVIRLQRPSGGFTRAMVEHTFCHELTHCILMTLNEEKLNKDEKLVDLIGGCLHQILSTAKGGLE